MTRQINTFLPKSLLHVAHIGETSSMLYTPYYVKQGLYNAILDQRVAIQPPKDFDLESFGTEKDIRGIQFLPTLCPDCGWDLEGDRDSLILGCRNCKTAWEPMRDGLKKISVAHLAAIDENIIYLPFWRIKAEVTGFDLNNYTDLVKLANLPKVVQDHQGKNPFYFWGPAFKIRPQKLFDALNACHSGATLRGTAGTATTTAFTSCKYAAKGSD